MTSLRFSILTYLLLVLIIDSEALVFWRFLGRKFGIKQLGDLHCSALAMSAFTNEQLTEMVQNALTHHKNGNNAEAVAAYVEVIPLIKGKAKTSLCGNLAAIYTAQGQNDKALEYLQLSVEEDPENASAQYNLAVLLATKTGEYGKAIKHCGKAMKLDGDSNFRAYHLMGNIMQNLDRPEEANKYFIRAEEIALELQQQQSIDGGGIPKADNPLQRLRVYSAKVGDISSIAVDGLEYRMECISESPLIFEVENLLSSDECDHIKDRASSLLEKSFVMGGDASYEHHQRHKDVAAAGSVEAVVTTDGTSSADVIDPSLYRSSYNAWLHEDQLLLQLQKRIAALLNLPIQYLQQKSEELQVVRYDIGGQFKVHQDASNFNPRLFTALVYLNNATTSDVIGGETWFPFCGSDALPRSDATREGTGVDNVEEAIRKSLTAYEDAKSNGNLLPGLRISPAKGKAIIFFNLLTTGAVDESAVHAGLPLMRVAQSSEEVSSPEKWIANYWVALDSTFLKNL